MCRSPDATYQVSWKTTDWFRGQAKSFAGFYHIEAWRPYSLCDPDVANKLSFPLPKEVSHKIRLSLHHKFNNAYIQMQFLDQLTPLGTKLRLNKDLSVKNADAMSFNLVSCHLLFYLLVYNLFKN